MSFRDNSLKLRGPCRSAAWAEPCLGMARQRVCCGVQRGGGGMLVLELGGPGHACRCWFLGSLSPHPVLMLRLRALRWASRAHCSCPAWWPAFSARMSHPEALTFSHVSQHMESKDWQLLPRRARPLCDPVYLVLEGVLCHVPYKPAGRGTWEPGGSCCPLTWGSIP